MAEQESELHPPGTVIQAWSKAWTLNGRLLRPAMVVVAKAPDGGTRRPREGVNRWANAAGRVIVTERNGKIRP